MTTEWHEVENPTPLAVKCGRIVFCFVGSVLLAIAGCFSYYNPQSQVLLSAGCLFVGLLLLICGIGLPPKMVAHFGFWLPWFLPNE